MKYLTLAAILLATPALAVTGWPDSDELAHWVNPGPDPRKLGPVCLSQSVDGPNAKCGQTLKDWYVWQSPEQKCHIYAAPAPRACGQIVTTPPTVTPPTGQPQPIPLPAGLPLLLGALAGLAWLGRKP